MKGHIPKIEVVLATKGENLPGLLYMVRCVMAQSFEDFRLTILANGNFEAISKALYDVKAFRLTGTFRLIKVPGGPLGNWGHSANKWFFENNDNIGEWSYIISDDDCLPPRTLELFSMNFEGHEIVIGRALSVHRGDYRFHFWLGDDIKVNHITGSCCIYRTDVLREVGYDDSEYASDWNLIEKFVRRGKVAHIPSIVYILSGPLN